MSQLAQVRSGQKVAAKPPPRLQLAAAPIGEAIREGSVLLKGGMALPKEIQLDLRPAGEWNLVTNEDATALSRKLAQAGTNFFFVVPAVGAVAVALDRHKALRKALRDIVQQVDGKGFNAVEIAGIKTRRRLGLWVAKITAHPRHLRNSPYIRDLDPYHYPTGVWNFTRMFTGRNRRTPQVKAM